MKTRNGLVAIVIAIVMSLTATACLNLNIKWTLAKTHGLYVEVTAMRASINIYKAPRAALYDIYKAGGINMTQDILWAVGKPPTVSGFCIDTPGFVHQQFCLSTSAIYNYVHALIYVNDADLKSALIDAENNGDCLALTLISYGVYAPNWTHKGGGCITGQVVL